MAESNPNPYSPGPQDNWRQRWEDRREDIDRGIVSALGAGRTVDEAFSEVSGTARNWTDSGAGDAALFDTSFREYYESRLENLERGGALARQENGSFYVNPEYVSGEGPGNRGTMEQRYVEGATSSRSSEGSGDPAR